MTTYGYKYIKSPNHPFAVEGGWILEHRLIAEKYLLTDYNSIEINDKKYLSPMYEVHHKDKNRLNNNVNNLEVLTKSDHMKLHAKLRFGK